MTDSSQDRGFTMPGPAEKMISTAAAAALTPIAAARRVLPAKGGLPLYAGLGGLALIGVIDWPIALAAGAGYGLAQLCRQQDQPQQSPSAYSASGAARPPAPAPAGKPPSNTPQAPGSTAIIPQAEKQGPG